ncbi:MAG: Rieske 2Fe-2S domain-containing protein [Methylotenera sp.]|nr:Rieske 2Fe-2S domain-containing protein [Methylotenera sp.]
MSNDMVVFKSEELQDGAKGLRFALPALGEFVTGFVVRFHGKPYAYVNQCAHIPVELDWNEGDFFTVQKDYLICSTHGAHYRPDNGFCVMGPCKGKSLKPISVTEQNQEIIINTNSINNIPIYKIQGKLK